MYQIEMRLKLKTKNQRSFLSTLQMGLLFAKSRFKYKMNFDRIKNRHKLVKKDPLKSTTYFRNDGRSEPCILGEVLPPTIH